MTCFRSKAIRLFGIALIIAVVLAVSGLSVISITANAADANGDGKIDVADVTKIQTIIAL